MHTLHHKASLTQLLLHCNSSSCLFHTLFKFAKVQYALMNIEIAPSVLKTKSQGNLLININMEHPCSSIWQEPRQRFLCKICISTNLVKCLPTTQKCVSSMFLLKWSIFGISTGQMIYLIHKCLTRWLKWIGLVSIHFSLRLPYMRHQQSFLTIFWQQYACKSSWFWNYPL